MSTLPKSPRRFERGALAWFLGVVGLGLSGYSLYALGIGAYSCTWPFTEETRVISAEAIPSSFRKRGSEPYYEPVISYAYEVTGHSHQGGRVMFGIPLTTAHQARDIVDATRRGPFRVYYYPDLPEISVLAPGMRWVNVIPLIAALAVWGLMRYAIWSRRHDEEHTGDIGGASVPAVTGGERTRPHPLVAVLRALAQCRTGRGKFASLPGVEVSQGRSISETLWTLQRNLNRGPQGQVIETEDALIIRFPQFVAFAMTVGGGAGLWALHQFATVPIKWPFYAGLGFLTGLGVLSLFSKPLFVVDIPGRIWKRYRQVFWWTQEWKGLLSETELHLTVYVVRRPRTELYQSWLVTLMFKGSDEFIDLYLSASEEDARARWQALAEKLAIPAMDDTKSNKS